MEQREQAAHPYLELQDNEQTTSPRAQHKKRQYLQGEVVAALVYLQ